MLFLLFIVVSLASNEVIQYGINCKLQFDLFVISSFNYVKTNPINYVHSLNTSTDVCKPMILVSCIQNSDIICEKQYYVINHNQANFLPNKCKRHNKIICGNYDIRCPIGNQCGRQLYMIPTCCNTKKPVCDIGRY